MATSDAGYLYPLLRGAILSVRHHAPVEDPVAGCAVRHTGPCHLRLPDLRRLLPHYLRYPYVAGPRY